MQRLLIVACLMLAVAPALSQDTIAYWAQNNNNLTAGGFGFEPGDFPQAADAGNGSLSLVDFDASTETDGSYSTIASFGGTSSNAQDGASSGGSLSVVGDGNNGMAIELTVDTTGFRDIELSWAQRGTSTGFSSRVLSYSVDGGNSFTEFATDSATLGSSWAVVSHDFATVDSLDDNADVVFRLRLDGATAGTGNNRVDNIYVQGRALDPDTALFGNDFSSDPFAAGWQAINVTGSATWEWGSAFSNVSISAFDGACAANEDWLVSPVINLPGNAEQSLTVDVARGFGGDNPLLVVYATDFDGTDVGTANWQTLTTIESSDFTSNNSPQTFGPLSLNAVSGEIHLAFVFDYQAGSCSTWRVSGVSLTTPESAPFVCSDPATRIHAVQGEGLVSPLLGQTVQVEAIVTADFQDTADGGLGGFFLQEADADQDGNALTSEGVFVFDDEFGVDVNLGDRVRVAGTVAESFDFTRIESVSDVAVCATGQTGDTSAVALTLPAADALEFEALEGMRVQLPQTLTVSNVFGAVRYGEFAVSSQRLFNPTQVAAPGVDAQAVSDANALDRLIVDDARDGSNRLPLIHGSDNASSLDIDNPIRVGDRLSSMLEGVIGYSFGNYRIQPSTPPAFAAPSVRPDAPVRSSEANVRAASFNVENLFNTLDTGGSRCGPNALSCRGASTVAERNRQLVKLADAIERMQADLVALVEVENDADDAAMALLVDALNTRAGKSDWRFVASGHVGSDAIKPGYIYRESVLTPVGDLAVLDESIDPDFDTSRQRPALAQSFRADNGALFTAVALHLRSKSCSGASGLDADQGDGQGCWNEWRRLSTAALLRWLDTSPTGVADADVIVMGDFNAYAQEDPVRAMLDAGYSNAAIVSNSNDPAVSGYVFQGESGSLDHALLSAAFAEQLISAQHWQINADEIPVFDYSEGDLPGGSLLKPADFLSDTAERSSDHDPLVVDFALPTLGESIFRDRFEPVVF
jgi:predicted extracellular nuclease